MLTAALGGGKCDVTCVTRDSVIIVTHCDTFQPDAPIILRSRGKIIARDQQLLHSGGKQSAISIKWQFADIEQPVILSGTNYSKYKVQRNPNIVMWLWLHAVA